MVWRGVRQTRSRRFGARPVVAAVGATSSTRPRPLLLRALAGIAPAPRSDVPRAGMDSWAPLHEIGLCHHHDQARHRLHHDLSCQWSHLFSGRTARRSTLVLPSGPFFGRSARALHSQRLAHANSIARMAKPAGIKRKAGPGSTIKARPASSTVPPMRATTKRLIVRRALMWRLPLGGGFEQHRPAAILPCPRQRPPI